MAEKQYSISNPFFRKNLLEYLIGKKLLTIKGVHWKYNEEEDYSPKIVSYILDFSDFCSIEICIGGDRSIIEVRELRLSNIGRINYRETYDTRRNLKKYDKYKLGDLRNKPNFKFINSYCNSRVKEVFLIKEQENFHKSREGIYYSNEFYTRGFGLNLDGKELYFHMGINRKEARIEILEDVLLLKSKQLEKAPITLEYGKKYTGITKFIELLEWNEIYIPLEIVKISDT